LREFLIFFYAVDLCSYVLFTGLQTGLPFGMLSYSPVWNLIKFKIQNVNEPDHTLKLLKLNNSKWTNCCKARVRNVFKKCRSHLKIVVTGRVTWSKFHTEDPPIVGAAVQNLVTRAPGICASQTVVTKLGVVFCRSQIGIMARSGFSYFCECWDSTWNCTVSTLFQILLNSEFTVIHLGHAVAQLVEALRYKPEGRGFDSRWCHWHNPFGRTMALGSTQPLKEMSTRNISWGIKAAGA
jgi:hypothetical protein